MNLTSQITKFLLSVAKIHPGMLYQDDDNDASSEAKW